MRRPLAALVLAATAWSYGAAVQCEMGSVAFGAEQTPADAPTDPHAHHGAGPAGDDGPGRVLGHGESHESPAHDHGGDQDDERCLMVMACGVASTVALAPGGVLHVAAGSRAILPPSSRAPVVSAPSLEPPPPRSSA